HVESPWHVGGLAPQLAVDEVADATREQADARQRRGEIEYVGHPALAPHGKYAERQHHAEQSAVERHAAIPDLDGVPRILRGPERQAIEQHIADAATQDGAEHAEEHEVIDVAGLPRGAGLPRA